MINYLFCIRYSVITNANKKQFVIGRNQSIDDYKAQLFDADRLAVHEELFFKTTLPSIDYQVKNTEGVNASAIVLTSPDLPEPFLGNLKRKAEEYEWLTVAFVSIDETVSDSINAHIESSGIHHGPYCTVRIDDDDAVSHKFLENSKRFVVDGLNGCLYSQSKGVNAWYDRERKQYTEMKDAVVPKVSVGMMLIKTDGIVDNVYNAGNHAKIDLVAPVLVDSRRVSFFRSMYDLQDTGGIQFGKKDDKKNPKREKADVTKHFPIEPDMFA